MRFQNKTVIVTGAAGGIGTAIARRFADEGGRVVMTDMNAQALDQAADAVRAAGGQARALVSDISAPEGCRAIIEDVMGVEGQIDVLCNNAGLMRRGNLLSLSDQDWDLSFAVNIDAIFHLCRAALPHMIAGGGGAIVNTASQWGLHPAPITSPIMSPKPPLPALPRTLRATMRRRRSA